MSFVISFEGIEACGKTTQIRLLKEKLEKLHHKVFLFREPGGTDLSEKIASLLKDKNLQINPITELLLFSASRNQLIEEKIIPLRKENNIIILDRYIDSTIAYQQYGRGISEDIINYIIKISAKNFLPNKTIFLDIPIKESFKRMKKRGKLDRMEQENLVFHTKIKNAFDNLCLRNKTRFIRINGLGEENDIHTNIFKSIKPLI